MLCFVSGKAGSGKTTCLHKLLAKKVREENTQAILIVPKQFTFESDTRILDILGPKDACSVEVLSFSRLASLVLTTCKGIKKPPLEEGANAVIMALALESVKDNLKFFSRHISNIAFIKKMLSEIKGFKKSMVTPNDLKEASRKLPQGLLRSKTEETAIIYETYNALLERSFYDDNDLLSIVYEILSDSDFFLEKTVAIDGFSSFSVQELKIISLMLRDAKEVYISLTSDNLENCDMSSPFALTNETARRLKRENQKIRDDGVKEIICTDKNEGFSTYSAEELYFLRDNLYKNAYTPFKEKVEAVGLICARDFRDECNAVARKIKRLMRKGEYRCRDIAVVYSDEAYEKEIRHSFKKYGVPLFEDKRQPIQNEPLTVYIRTLLTVCEKGLSTESIMRLLKTGLSSLDTDSIAMVENYAYMWSFSGKDWEKEWTENPDGFGFELSDEKKRELSLLNEKRKEIVLPLLKLKKEVEDKNGQEVMTLLYNFLMENGVNERLKEYALFLEEKGDFDLAKEQEQVWNLIMEVINKIAVVTEKLYLSQKRLGEIFDLVVSTESLGKLPDGFDEVYICSKERIATIVPKVIFVLGANEGVFPKAVGDSGVFPEREKEKLRSFIPDLKDGTKTAVIKERFNVYNALSSARERLFVSYSLVDSKGVKIEPSEIVYMIRKILPLTETEDMTKERVENLIESEKSAFELMASLWNDNSEKAVTLRRFFREKQEYKGKIEAIERLSKRNGFEFKSKETAKELFGLEMRLSASRLEDYELCPFMYFLKHEIRAKERKTARLDPAQSGTLVHFVLEKLLSKYEGKKFLSLSKQQLLSEIQKLLTQYIETYMGGFENKTQRFSYLYNRSLKILCAIVDRLLYEFSDSDFEPCDFELKIDRDGKIQPFKVELEEGSVELRGIVDRVDKMEKNGNCYLRVVDYKTGVKNFSLSDVLGGLGMQMVLYLVSIWRNGKDYYGENIVPAGVLYLPARFEPYAVNRNDKESVVYEKRLESGKMDGIILDDGDVIKGMNKSLNGVMIPISINKSGGIKGNFINLEQLGKLADRMDEIMAEMGNELHNGKIPAKPAFGKDHGKTCEFCRYKGVCMRPEGVEYRYIEKLNHTQSLEKLERGESNVATLDFETEKRH